MSFNKAKEAHEKLMGERKEVIEVNEYQEALDFFVIGRTFSEEETEDMYEMRHRLLELVDKETPMKPKITLHNAYCWECGEAFGFERASHVNVSKWTAYCPVCGKKQDWSDEE